MKKLISYLVFLLMTVNIFSQEIGVVASSQSTSSSLLTGLLIYYKSDESSGNLIDASGNSRTGTATSLTYSQTGKIGTCVQFNGTSSKVTISSYPAPTSSFTISFWLKTTSAASATLYECFNETSGVSGIWIQYYDGLITIMMGNGTTLSSEYPLTGTWNDGVWHNFIFTYNSTNIRAYVDNVSKLTDTFSGAVDYTGVTSLSLMASSSSYYIAGYLDEFGVWNKVVSSGEATTLSTGTLTHPW